MLLYIINKFARLVQIIFDKVKIMNELNIQKEQVQLMNVIANKYHSEFFPATADRLSLNGLKNVLKHRNMINKEKKEKAKKYVSLYGQQRINQHTNQQKDKLLGLRGIQIDFQAFYLNQTTEQSEKTYDAIWRYSDIFTQDSIIEQRGYISKSRSKQYQKQQILSNFQFKQFLQISHTFEQIYRSKSKSTKHTKILQLLSKISGKSSFLEKLHFDLRMIIQSEVTQPYGAIYIIAEKQISSLQEQFSRKFRDFKKFIPNQHITEKWRHIYKLVQTGQSNKKILNDLLFSYNQQSFYSLLKEYEMLFVKKISSAKLIQFSDSLNRWINNQKTIAVHQQAVFIMMDPYFQLSSKNILRMQQIQKQFSPEDLRFFILMTTLKWLKLSLYDQELKEYTFYQQKVNNFCILRENLTQSLDQSISFSNIINIQKSQSDFSKIQTLIFLSSILSSQIVIEIIKCFKNYPHQLLTQVLQKNTGKILMALCSNFQFNHLTLCFLVYISSHTKKVEVLTSSQQFVQNIDWEYFGKIFDNSTQFMKLFQFTIYQSIRKYDNPEKFINMAIPQYLKPSYYQIDALLSGLKSILTTGKKLTASDKNNYFGIISMFRGQNIPREYHNSISLLQMLFQWFIIQESIMNRDIKSIAISLSAILDDVKQNQMSNTFSVKLTDSMQYQSSTKFHNYEFLNRLWTEQFIKWLITFEKGKNYYLLQGFLSTLTDGLFLIKKNKHKMIRFQQIEQWKQILTDNLSQVGKFMKGIFAERFSTHTKIILSQIFS